MSIAVAGVKRRRSASLGSEDWGGERLSHPEKRWGNFDSYEGFEAPNSRLNASASTGEYDADGEADVFDDPRLAAVSSSIFKGANVLEIGCGAGYLCVQLAERLGAASVLGVDIDGALISKARGILAWRKARLRSCSSNIHSRAVGAEAPSSRDFVPLSMRITQRWKHASPPPLKPHLPAANVPSAASAQGSDEGKEKEQAAVKLARLNQVRFLCSNILLHPISNPSKPSSGDHDSRRSSGVAGLGQSHRHRDVEGDDDGDAGRGGRVDATASSVPPSWTPPPASFDVVVLFNVTKYVHLNEGDDGLVRLFQVAHSYLKPGGRLLLVAQRWASYNKHKHLCASFSGRMAGMAINPDRRDEMLHLLTGERVGFKQIEAVVTATKPFAGRKLKNKAKEMQASASSSETSLASATIASALAAPSVEAASSTAAATAATAGAAAGGRTCELLVLRK